MRSSSCLTTNIMLWKREQFLLYDPLFRKVILAWEGNRREDFYWRMYALRCSTTYTASKSVPILLWQLLSTKPCPQKIKDFLQGQDDSDYFQSIHIDISPPINNTSPHSPPHHPTRKSAKAPEIHSAQSPAYRTSTSSDRG